MKLKEAAVPHLQRIIAALVVPGEHLAAPVNNLLQACSVTWLCFR